MFQHEFGTVDPYQYENARGGLVLKLYRSQKSTEALMYLVKIESHILDTQTMPHKGRGNTGVTGLPLAWVDGIPT